MAVVNATHLDGSLATARSPSDMNHAAVDFTIVHFSHGFFSLASRRELDVRKPTWLASVIVQRDVDVANIAIL
jgi:hypothetical protein